MSPHAVDATVLIPTYNRAALLDETLQSLRSLRLRPGRTWNVLVVDNNSSDGTRAVVERHALDFPVPLRYLFEERQGRSSALNAGLAAADGAVIAMTDDDVRVDEGWLEAACDALADGADPSIAYAGGPVSPIWEKDPPDWLDLTRGDLWGTIAIQNHGPDGVVYDDKRKVPLGANMAARRSLFGTIGAFRPDLGRSSGRVVMGQEVPELLMRARAAGLRGVYVPAMRVHHHIPARRLDRAYFRRWWFGKGVSRSLLEQDQPVTELGVDLRKTPHVLRVPRYMYRSALADVMGWMRGRARRRPAAAFRHEMMLAYFAGYAVTRVRGLAATTSTKAPVASPGRHTPIR
jgi:glycosyltransferase involved in cell wall biosynthesis